MLTFYILIKCNILCTLLILPPFEWGNIVLALYGGKKLHKNHKSFGKGHLTNCKTVKTGTNIKEEYYNEGELNITANCLYSYLWFHVFWFKLFGHTCIKFFKLGLKLWLWLKRKARKLQYVKKCIIIHRVKWIGHLLT